MASKSALEALLEKRAATPEMIGFAEAFVGHAGGVSKLAQIVWEDLAAMKPGHPSRVRLLVCAIELLKTCSVKGKVKDPLENIDPEQMSAVLREFTEANGLSKPGRDSFAHPRA